MPVSLERIPSCATDVNGTTICQGDLVKLSYGNAVALVTVMPKKEFEAKFSQTVKSNVELPDNHPMAVIRYKFEGSGSGQDKWYERGLAGKVRIVGKVN